MRCIRIAVEMEINNDVQLNEKMLVTKSWTKSLKEMEKAMDLQSRRITELEKKASQTERENSELNKRLSVIEKRLKEQEEIEKAMDFQNQRMCEVERKAAEMERENVELKSQTLEIESRIQTLREIERAPELQSRPVGLLQGKNSKMEVKNAKLNEITREMEAQITTQEEREQETGTCCQTLLHLQEEIDELKKGFFKIDYSLKIQQEREKATASQGQRMSDLERKANQMVHENSDLKKQMLAMQSGMEMLKEGIQGHNAGIIKAARLSKRNNFRTVVLKKLDT